MCGECQTQELCSEKALNTLWDETLTYFYACQSVHSRRTTWQTVTSLVYWLMKKPQGRSETLKCCFMD